MYVNEVMHVGKKKIVKRRKTSLLISVNRPFFWFRPLRNENVHLKKTVLFHRNRRKSASLKKHIEQNFLLFYKIAFQTNISFFYQAKQTSNATAISTFRQRWGVPTQWRLRPHSTRAYRLPAYFFFGDKAFVSWEEVRDLHLWQVRRRAGGERPLGLCFTCAVALSLCLAHAGSGSDAFA